MTVAYKGMTRWLLTGVGAMRVFISVCESLPDHVLGRTEPVLCEWVCV